jgi:tetrahydromethanopterin S-methyltransferase subunit F
MNRLLVQVAVFFVFAAISTGCGKDSAPAGPTKDQLREVLENFIKADLDTLNSPVLQELTIVDTMFSKEFLKRESIIYERGLVDKDRRMRMAIQSSNENGAILDDNPDDATAKANYSSAQRTIENIQDSQRLFDSLTTVLKTLEDSPAVYYYEILARYEVKGTDGEPEKVLFIGRIDPNLQVIQAGRTGGKGKNKRTQK